MNKKHILMSFLCGMVLPMVFLAVAIHTQETQPLTSEPVATTQPEPTQQNLQQEEKICVLTDGETVKTMLLQEYLTGVVLSEMPADFHPEALKAQAVVARTYAMKRAEKTSKHTQAAVCADPACCQGYKSPEQYLANGGSQESVDKVTQAVQDTAGQVLTYQGELIDATYFSCSGGSTEAAVAVWGSDVPYLQAVESPGEEGAVHYTDQVTFTAEEFSRKTNCGGTGDPQGWFGAVTYTDGGGVQTMELCGKTYEGTQLRRLLSLRSTVFSVSVAGQTITVTTKGFGHRVGMSQYGAEAMAQSGCIYEEILLHYYRGTQLQTAAQ